MWMWNGKVWLIHFSKLHTPNQPLELLPYT